MNKKLAVIVPVYNVEAYVSCCLDSLLAQTYQDWVAYVVDDGSTDNSGNIIDKYKEYDKFVILHKKNGGLSSARNYALDYIDSTNTEYTAVTFLDSDDWLAPDAYEVLMSSLNTQKADIVFSGHKKIFPDGRMTEEKFSCVEGEVSHSEYFAAVFSYGESWRGKNGSWGVVWNKIFRMNCIRGYRFVEDQICEDELFSLQAGLTARKFYFIDRSFIYYRQRDDSLIRASDFSIKLIRGRELCLQYIADFSGEYINDVIKYICCGSIRTIINCSKNIPIFVDNFLYISRFLYGIKDVVNILFNCKDINIHTYKYIKFIIYTYEKNISACDVVNYINLYNTTMLVEQFENLRKTSREMNKISMFKKIRYYILSKIMIGNKRLYYKSKYKEFKKSV